MYVEMSVCITFYCSGTGYIGVCMLVFKKIWFHMLGPQLWIKLICFLVGWYKRWLAAYKGICHTKIILFFMVVIAAAALEVVGSVWKYPLLSWLAWLVPDCRMFQIIRLSLYWPKFLQVIFLWWLLYLFCESNQKSVPHGISFICWFNAAVLIAEKVGVVGDSGSGGNSGIECQITGILLNLWFCFHKGAEIVYLVWWAGRTKW